MRVRELHDQIISPTRPLPYADEEAWCSLIDALILAVREEERATTLGMLKRLAIGARALPTPDAVARLVTGIAKRDYGA